MHRPAAVGTIVALLAVTSQGRAQVGSPAKPIAIDLFLAIDNSGSMKGNDPEFRLRTAVQRFALAFGPSTRIGIVLFDEGSRTAMPLTGRAEDSFAIRLGQGLEKLTYSGQYTDLPDGFERALSQLREYGRADAGKSIALVTDGVVDLRDAAQVAGRKKWLQEDLLREAVERNVRVFGVAFTEQADLQLLQSLATATKGSYKRVVDAGGFDEYFTRMATDATTLPPVAKPQPSSEERPQPPVGRGWGGLTPWLPLFATIGISTLLAVTAWMLWRRRERAALEIPPAERACLRDLLDPDYVVAIEHRRIVIGREEGSDVALKDNAISQPHASIEFRNGAFYLRDMRSANRTVLDAVHTVRPRTLDPLQEVPLKHGDIIRFGRVRSFVFETLAGGQTVVSPDGTRVLPDGTRVSPDGTRVLPDGCHFHPDTPVAGFCHRCRLPVCSVCQGGHVCQAQQET